MIQRMKVSTTQALVFGTVGAIVATLALAPTKKPARAAVSCQGTCLQVAYQTPEGTLLWFAPEPVTFGSAERFDLELPAGKVVLHVAVDEVEPGLWRAAGRLEDGTTTEDFQSDPRVYGDEAVFDRDGGGALSLSLLRSDAALPVSA